MGGQRVVSYDITKGLLVLAMVAHHSWGAFGGERYSHTVWYAFSFVTSSFIALSGIGIGSFLITQYWSNPSERAIKDVKRAGRLALLYSLANGVIYFINYRGVADSYDPVRWGWQLFLGIPADEVVFQVLGAFVAFFVLASLVLLTLAQCKRLGISYRGFCGLIVATSTALAIWILFGKSVSAVHLHPLIGYGWGGLAVSSFAQLIKHSSEKNLELPVWCRQAVALSVSMVVVYVLHRAFSKAPIEGGLLALYTAAMLWIFANSQQLIQREWVTSSLVWLGKNSLFAYVVQVIGARILTYAPWEPVTSIYELLESYILASLLVFLTMACAIAISDRIRRTSKYGDMVFRSFFG
jgi:hypothetical protein